MCIIGLICARGGSKGIKKKNLLKINNISLVGRSILQAKKCPLINKIYISTDSTEIANEAQKYGGLVPFLRPKKISGDKTSEILVWRHFINYIEKKIKKIDYIVSIPPTAPLRKIKDINECLRVAIKNKADIVLTGSISHRNPYFNMVKIKNKKISLICSIKKKIVRRQDAPKCYDLTTVCYVFRPSYIKNNSNLFSNKTRLVIIPKERSLDIDNNFDYEVAKFLFKSNKYSNN
jgi:CMP-N,N'-diacetyllegionaminic acid synthase